MFIETRRTMGFKLEGTAYTAETLAASDYDVAAYNINYGTDIESVVRKVARGDMSREAAVMGKRKGTISFSVDVCYSGAVATAPKYFKCLKACGMKQTAHTTTGISLVPHADYTNVPATIEVVEKDEGTTPVQLVFKFHGCMGNAKLILDNVGKPVRIDFEFMGVLNNIFDRAYASILNPGSFDTVQPEAILGVTFSLFTESQAIDTVTIDLGNKVEGFTDPSKAQGLQGFHIVDRETTMECDPDMTLIATHGDFARWTANSTGSLLYEIGDNITVSGIFQYTNPYAPGSREGHVTAQKKLIAVRGTSGNDEFKILQGTE